MDNSIAYILGAVCFIVFLLLVVISANAIAYESGVNPRDPAKRKMWFWILGILYPIVTFFVLYFGWYQDIKIPAQASSFLTATIIATAASFVLYVVFGVILSKTFSHSKLKSWF